MNDKRPMIIGEGPSKTNDGEADGKRGPFDGPGGRWIADLMSDKVATDERYDLERYHGVVDLHAQVVTLDEFLEAFERVNVFPDSTEWNRIAAIPKMGLLLPRMQGRLVLLMGRNVEDALHAIVRANGAKTPKTEFFERRWIMIGKVAWCEAITCPHPSKRSRWWNDSINVQIARHFWVGMRNETTER